MDSNLPPGSTPPPYNTPPPVIAPAYAPRPARRGTGWKIFAVILLVLLCLSMLLNFKHAVSSIAGGRGGVTHTYGPRLEEVTMKESASANKIVVVPIEGVISGQALDQGGYSMVTVVREELKRAREDSSVKAVILKVDSPGGEVLASDEIANAIREFHKKSGKPVIVSMGSLAASGGYYVSAPCEWIVANELTITGSIGVIMHGFNYRGLLDKVGVRPEVFKSGRYKDMLSGTKSPEEITPEEKQMVQALIDETYGKFKGVVKAGREAAFKGTDHSESNVSHALSSDWESYADGRVLSGTEAKRLGFVDELGDFEVAENRAQKLAGITAADLVEYQPVFDLSNLFHIFGKSDAKGVKIDLGIDVPKLRAGCLYFLSSTYLQ
ncbi:MAG: Signal peptide peptidase SppA, type [Pedosphaera sp.]|nr:Signal peptide peptidase SppA, type [Pedosphaera sp.]